MSDAKKSVIRPARKIKFNSRRFRNTILKKRRKSLLELIFPKQTNFWWDSSSNGIFGPGGHTTYSFRNGSLALLIAIISIIIIVGYILLDKF